MRDRFTVKDEAGKDVYYVEGSFMKIPKSFSIKDYSGKEIGLITKKVFSFLPKFFVEVRGREILTIKKEFTFFKDRYTIEGADIDILGDWWDMNFRVYRRGQEIGRVNKVWFSWGDSYRIEILDEEMEEIMIAIVIAIDCVKDDEHSSNSATMNINN